MVFSHDQNNLADEARKLIATLKSPHARVAAIVQLIWDAKGTPVELEMHAKSLFDNFTAKQQGPSLASFPLLKDHHCAIIFKSICDTLGISCKLVSLDVGYQFSRVMNLVLLPRNLPNSTAVNSTDILEIFWRVDADLQMKATPVRSLVDTLPISGGQQTVVETHSVFGTMTSTLGSFLKRLDIPRDRSPLVMATAPNIGIFSHDNLCVPRKIFISPGSNALQFEMPLAPQNLHDVIKHLMLNQASAVQSTHQVMAINIAFQVISALAYLHGSPFPSTHPEIPRTAHLNLKPRNVLVVSLLPLFSFFFFFFLLTILLYYFVVI